MEHWLQAQRIGVTSCLVHVLAQDDPLFEPCRLLLLTYLEKGGEGGDVTKFLPKLPFWVLKVLWTVMEQVERVGAQLGNLRDPVQEALNRLEGGTKSPIWLIQVWTYHALFARTSAVRLVWLGRTLFSDSEWDRIRKRIEKGKEAIRQLAAPLGLLRAPWSTTDQRASAIVGMSTVLGETRAWPQIENILLHHVFCWPLLILSGTAGAPHGVSLPVSVDLMLPEQVPNDDDGLFDDAAFERIHHHDYINCQGGESGIVSVDDWSGRESRDGSSSIKHLEKAVRVAKQLWRAQHGHTGVFKKTVKRARVTFDFSYAQDVVSDLEHAGLGELSLEEGSADAYFAQVILNKLRGGPGITASAVTGLIGNKLRSKDASPALNYEFKAPGGIPEKLKYVFACRTFERVVVPVGEKGDETVKHFEQVLTPTAGTREAERFSTGGQRAEQTAQIFYARDLHVLADIVQVGGWRRYRYERCPEVAWALDGPGRLIAGDDPRVKLVAQFLSSNSSPVAQLENASPVVIASALSHLNARRKAGSYIPPALTWAFVRALDTEQDSRFWHIVWRVCGASEDDFNEFLRNPSNAVDRIARVLNKFEPDRNSPGHRAPDVLVIVGSERFRQAAKEWESPASRPLMVDPLLRELDSKLRVLSDSRLVRLVGRSRVLLLPQDETDPVNSDIRFESLSPREVEQLKALAVFEWGFLQQPASLVLSEFDIKGLAVRTLLNSFVDRGALRLSQGMYHMPAGIRQRVGQTDKGGTLARRHYLAGRALAPFVTKRKFPALALDAALAPERIHEAQKHFKLALDYAQQSGARELRDECRSALQDLHRFGGAPSWGAVKSLLKAKNLGKDAYQMARELLTWDEDTRVTHHPAHLVLAGRAAGHWTKTLRGPNNVQLCGEVTAEAERHFRDARDACVTFPGEESLNRLHVLTWYCMYLVEHDPGRDEDIRCLRREAADLLDRGVSGRGVAAEWFEWMADSEDAHPAALDLYALGQKWTPEWAQLWVKGLGAASLAGDSPRVQAVRDHVATTPPARILAKVENKYREYGGKGPKHRWITDRWQEGFRLFQESWGEDPNVSRVLDRLHALARRGTPK